MYTSTVKLAVLITTVGVEVITTAHRCRGNYLHPHMRMCMYTSTVKLAVLITTVGVEVITSTCTAHEDVHVHFYCKTCRANYYSRCRGNYLHPHMRMCMYTSTVKLAVLITTVGVEVITYIRT